MTRARAAALVWLALGVMTAAILFYAPAVVGDRLGLRRFLTPEVTADWPIAQRFLMNAPRLSAIVFRTAIVGPVVGRVQLRLVDLSSGNQVVRSADVPASDLVRESSYAFSFEPIEDSAGRPYRLEIVSSKDVPARGVALRATKGARLPDAYLIIRDEERWADLAFHAQAFRPSKLNALLLARDAGRPPGWAALTGLLAIVLILWPVLRAVGSLPTEAFASERVPDAS